MSQSAEQGEPEQFASRAVQARSARRRVWIRVAIGVLAVAGMLGGWAAMALQKSRVQAAASGQIEAAGGRVYRDYQWIDGQPRPDAPPRQPAWLRRLIGPAAFDRAVSVDLSGVARPAGICAQLPRLPYLQVLHAAHPLLDDADLESVALLRGLKELDLTGTQITDRGVAQLRHLTTLRALSLAGTDVSDQCLAAVEQLTRLEILDLTDTSISPQGCERLHRSLPRCRLVGP